MTTILEKRFFNRSDTSVNWASFDPVLGLGEVGFESDTNRFKMGDGVARYTQRPYADGQSTAVSGVTYDGLGRVITYTRDGIAHTVSYPDSTTIVDTDGTNTKTVTLDGFGRVTSIS